LMVYYLWFASLTNMMRRDALPHAEISLALGLKSKSSEN
jgi:hypothetical protein